MADINQQTEELARIMEQVNREMAYYGQITKATADQKRDAEIEAATGMKNFTKASGTAADAVGHLANAGMAAGKAMLEGKKGAAAFNESIDGLAKAATAAGVALTLLVPGGALIKGLVAGFTAVTAATAGLVKASNEMADKIYKGYSGLAKSGAAASDGMTGVYNDAKKLGLSMNDLDSLVGLVGENAKDLALFSGSVFEGRKQFADIGQAMEPYRKSLIAAGMTQEQINEGTMQYIRLQTRVGLAQNKTTQELAEGAKKYLQEQDALTKLTGQSRQEQEAALEEARSQMRFRAKLEEMRGSGDEKQIAAAAQLEKTYVLLRSQSKEAAQGFGDMTTGMIGTEASQKLLMSTNGEALQTANQMVAGQKDAIAGTQAIAAAAGKTTKDMNMLYQTGAAEGFLLSIDEGSKLGLLAQKDLAAQYKKIEEDQKKQGQEGGKAADGITDQYAKNIVQQQKLNAKMEDVVFKGIDNALVITNKLGNATDTLATGFEVLGKAVNKLLNIFGLGVKEPAVPTAPTKEQEAAGAAVTTAKAKADEADKKLADQMAATDALKKSLETIAKTNDKSAETTAKIADLKKQIAASEQQELTLNKEAKLASAKKLEASAAQANANRAARGQASTSTATPTAAPAGGGKQELPSGVAPSAAGGGRGTASPPAGGPPRAAPPTAGSPPGGSAEGEQRKPTPEEKAQGQGGGSLKIGPNADMSGLDNEMISRLQKFAESTGKSVDVTSAYRSDQKQAELWVRGNILNEPGIFTPAAPKEDQEITYKGKTYNVKGSGKGSLHGVGNAVDISVAGMGKSKGPIDDLLSNAGLFRPYIAKDHPHVQMLAEGGIVQPTPGGTPAVIGEGGNAEAVIPLKGNRIPVDFPDEIKRFFQFQSQVDNLKFLKGDTGKNTYEDVDSVVAASQVKMFAKLESMKTELMSQGWDRGVLENYGEEDTKSGPKTEADVGDLQSRYNDDEVVESIKENAVQTRTLIDLISELVREQRNANDISTRILQVSSN
jgi:hypothetical protein